jgi:hypothetical protein
VKGPSAVLTSLLYNEIFIPSSVSCMKFMKIRYSQLEIYRAHNPNNMVMLYIVSDAKKIAQKGHMLCLAISDLQI